MGRIRPAPATLDPRFLRLGAAALALVTLVTTVSAARARPNPGETALARGALAAAAHWASAHPQARILADERTSDRLLWWHQSTVGHVALDGRLDFYDPDSIHVWFSYILGPSVPDSLAGKRFEHVSGLDVQPSALRKAPRQRVSQNDLRRPVRDRRRSRRLKAQLRRRRLIASRASCPRRSAPGCA
jgi:hypothetical protein